MGGSCVSEGPCSPQSRRQRATVNWQAPVPTRFDRHQSNGVNPSAPLDWSPSYPSAFMIVTRFSPLVSSKIRQKIYQRPIVRIPTKNAQEVDPLPLDQKQMPAFHIVYPPAIANH